MTKVARLVNFRLWSRSGYLVRHWIGTYRSASVSAPAELAVVDVTLLLTPSDVADVNTKGVADYGDRRIRSWHITFDLGRKIQRRVEMNESIACFVSRAGTGYAGWRSWQACCGLRFSREDRDQGGPGRN